MAIRIVQMLAVLACRNILLESVLAIAQTGLRLTIAKGKKQKKPFRGNYSRGHKAAGIDQVKPQDIGHRKGHAGLIWGGLDWSDQG